MTINMQRCYKESTESMQADRNTPETSAGKVLLMLLERPRGSDCRSLLLDFPLLCRSNPDRGSS